MTRAENKTKKATEEVNEPKNPFFDTITKTDKLLAEFTTLITFI